MTAPAVRAIGRAALAARPIGLPDALERAQLLARFERTYLVPARVFLDFAAQLSDPGGERPFRSLSIDGRRWFRYHSVYYDTAELRAYHDERQDRQHRFTVRQRRYEDSGERQFELKLAGGSGETVKYRRPLAGSPSDRALAGDAPAATPGPAASGPGIDGGSRRFLTDTLQEAYGIEPPEPPERLTPSLTTSYLRATFVAEGERVTCDAGLVCRDPGRLPGGDGHPHAAPPGAARAAGPAEARGARDLVVVETKSEQPTTATDRLLRELGVPAADFTKYASLAALRPALPGSRWRPALRQAFPALPATAAAG
ncbi:VTC domain-containing protein [Streptomyces sp. HNM0574]|uniref:VTC domain-containing protein n=1 Tax=Streptomyces sp. HNM0574 TaxID=2714954 RepID=UPI00146B67EF|nr:VTC domain-containing protein [Streptomyces sp. HNM0574]NLU68519.1 VTC domain-containing protein [Streptomyces sp. HNM0574]